MQKEIILGGIIILIIGYVIGRIVSYYNNRIQCVNCGKNTTYRACSGYEGVGGNCGFVVKHHEQHVCKSCNKITVVSMNLPK